MAPKSNRRLRRRVRKARGKLRMRGKKLPGYHFKRTFFIPATFNIQNIGGVGADVALSIIPTLSSVPDYTDFTSLFDQYAIRGCKISLMPKFSMVEGVYASNASGGGTWGGINCLPQIHSVLDYDGNGPSSVNAALQYQNLKTTPGHKIHSRYFKPRILSTLWRNPTAVTSAYASKKSSFIDTSYTDVNHYGMYVVANTQGMDENVKLYYDIKCTLYMSFKNVK